MSSSRQNHISSAPSYPGLLDNSSLWEENYRQRVRKMTRDYVNPNSTRLSHKRSLSADSRPQYNNGRVYKDNPASSSSEQFNHRAQGLNVFYPTLDESRARVVYDANGPQFPSQLPKPVSVDQTYFERTGRSLSPSRSRGSRTKNGGSRIYQMPSGLVDPFESSAGRLPSRQSVNPTLVITPKRHNFDFLKDSLIMFGDEASSMGTGASQQELLQERDKEQTGTRRNEKKERKRILNLPSTLFPSQPIRKQPQTSKRDTKSDFLHEGTDKEISPLAEQYVPPPLQFHSTTPASYSGSFDRMDSKRMVGNPDLAYKKVHNRIAPATRNPGNRIGSFDERDLRRTVGSPDPPANRRSQQSLSGRNSAMINRTGNQASSAGPRWKIIPSLSKSRSRSRSPVRHMASSEEKRGTASSTIRSTSSVGHEYANSKPTDMGFMEGDSCDDCSTDYKLDQRKPMDPPSHVIQISTYDSMDAEPSQWDNNYEKRIENQSDGTTSYDGEGNTDMYGETPWTSPQYPEKFSPGNQYAEDRRESNLRSKLGSTRADFTPSKGSEGAFPDFSTPTTPLTASMTSESSDFPSDFDPFTSKLSHSEQPMYDKASSSFLLFQRPEEYAKQVEATRNIDHLLPAMASKAKSKSAYATMSRLNNPPGLDMDFYAPSKPDAPATTSVASIADKSTNQRFSKVSPTSILDFQNPFVRWSDNLEQLPTPRRETFEQPRSILRNSRTQQAIGTKEEGASDESPCQTETMHVSETKCSMGRLISKYPSSLDFVDEDGHTLSPITSFEAAGGDQDIPAAKNVTSFERNIPEEFQRAVLYKNMAHNGYASAAYSDFIEAVASVVIQTTVRQFLAKINYQKEKRKRESSRKPSQYRWAQKAAAVGKRHVQFNLSARSSADANLDVFAVAAMRIQSMFRGWYARDCIAIDNYCATIIQNAYRSHSAEKRYQLDRNYIIRAQAWARRKRAFDVFATCMYCVVAIQAAFRAYQVRKSIRQRFQEPPSFIQHVAATVIQAQWRCFRCEMAFLRAYEDILLVQSVARGWVTRRLIKSWLRARNIKTFYICKETPRKAKGTPVYSYNLPHGYHNHTAFLRNNIPSPLRSPTSGKMLKEEGDAIVVNSTVSDPGSYQHKSKMTKDGLLEKYRKKRDKAMIDETRDARRETDIVDGKTGATNGKLSNGLQGCKRLGDTLRPKADCTSDQKNKHLFTRERLIAQANASDNCPRKANSDTGVTSHQEIRQGNQRTKADWRAKSQLIMKFGNANDSPQSEIPKNSQGTSNFQRKLTLSLSHDETVKRNKTNGLHDLVEGIREGGTSFASSRFSRSRLPQSASFDPTWTNQSTAVIASEVVSAAAAKPHIDSSHSSASLVLASWRNREKQGGAQDRNIIADVSNGRTDDVALENENKTTWCSNQKRDEASRGGTMPETISQGPTSWQHGRAGLSLSKSCDETRDHSQPCAKQGEEKPRSLNNNSLYQRTLRPVNQDKQDEKKDDVVRTTSNKVITEDASWKQHNPKEAGLILHKSKRMDTLGSLKVPGVAVTSQNIKESHPVKLVREQSNQSAETFKPIQSKSPIHVELRKKRSESEQQRIDSMHLIFIRSGLIGRHEKEKISFANTTSAEYEGKIRDADDDFEPTASDILNAWKGCDQTQPTMIGNLF